jgi:hypothetical protein
MNRSYRFLVLLAGWLRSCFFLHHPRFFLARNLCSQGPERGRSMSQSEIIGHTFVAGVPVPRCKGNGRTTDSMLVSL